MKPYRDCQRPNEKRFFGSFLQKRTAFCAGLRLKMQVNLDDVRLPIRGPAPLFARSRVVRHIGAMRIAREKTAGIVVAAAALVALGAAYLAEFGLLLVPCPLCLLERWPYWITALLGLLAALAPPRFSKILLGVSVLVLFAGAAIAFVHVGVEQGWWPSPLPECNAPPPAFGSLPLRPSISCSAPTFLIPGLPISMALMDMIYALAVAILLIIYLMRSNRRVR